jgi:hypothetical protein
VKIEEDTVNYVFEEAQRRFDREIPGWVEFKLLGADILRWARLEILSRSAQRSKPSEVLPSSPATAHSEASQADRASRPAGQSEADSTAPQDSGQLPTWLGESRPSAQVGAVYESTQ